MKSQRSSRLALPQVAPFEEGDHPEEPIELQESSILPQTVNLSQLVKSGVLRELRNFSTAGSGSSGHNTSSKLESTLKSQAASHSSKPSLH